VEINIRRFLANDQSICYIRDFVMAVVWPSAEIAVIIQPPIVEGRGK
jgi:hypothetical protein